MFLSKHLSVCFENILEKYSLGNLSMLVPLNKMLCIYLKDMTQKLHVLLHIKLDLLVCRNYPVPP